jgi:hypothetical protein
MSVYSVAMLVVVLLCELLTIISKAVGVEKDNVYTFATTM